VRTIAALTFLIGLVLALEGVRRLAIAGLGIHRSTFAQLFISGCLAAFGTLGVWGSASLARLSDRGRKATLAYLLALGGLYCVTGEMSAGGVVRLTILGASAAFLLSKQARNVCFGPAGTPI
jgi:hypothetical protein